jgi:hypothetical protein
MNKRKVRITNTGYLPNSPDRYNPMNIIPSNQITMHTVPFPIMGIDNLGNRQMMMPGMDYTFPGQYVTEIPLGKYQKGKQVPRVISDPEEFKIANQAYQDSLTVYNGPAIAAKNAKYIDDLINAGRFNEAREILTTRGFVPRNVHDAFDRLEDLNKEELEPIRGSWYGWGLPLSDPNAPVYKKPTQPVVFEPPLERIESKPLTKLPVTVPQLRSIDTRIGLGKGRFDSQSIGQLNYGNRTGQQPNYKAVWDNTNKKWTMQEIEPEEQNYYNEKNKIKKQYGGLTKYQKKGQVPRYIDDKDEFLKAFAAYQDSTILNQAMVMQNRLMNKNAPSNQYTAARKSIKNAPPISDFSVKNLKNNRIPRVVPGLESYGPMAKDFINEKDMFTDNYFVTKEDRDLIKYYKSLGLTDDNIMYHTSADVVHPKIRPVGVYWDGRAWSPRYAAPKTIPVWTGDPNFDPNIGLGIVDDETLNRIEPLPLKRLPVTVPSLKNIDTNIGLGKTFRKSQNIGQLNYGNRTGQQPNYEAVWDNVNKKYVMRAVESEEKDYYNEKNKIQKQYGGLVKYQDKGQVDLNTYPNQVLTYKDNPEWFDNRAMYSGDDRYDAQIRKLVYEGKGGYNPHTRTLHFLKPDQQTEVDQTTKTLSKDKRTWDQQDKKIVGKIKKDVTKMTPEKARQYIIDNQKDFVQKSALATGVLAAPFAAPAVIGSLEAPMIVAGSAVPGITVGNTIAALGTGYGITQLPHTYNIISKAVDNPTTSNITDAAIATGLNALDFVGVGIGKAAISGAKQTGKFITTETLLKNVTSSSANASKNLEDLQKLQEFANQYGYELPANLERIAQSDELTNRTIRGLMNRHNTFVRGISTNWDELQKALVREYGPEKGKELWKNITDNFEKNGIDYINNPQGAAEYMATHIPISTGYGRASLDNHYLGRGLEGLYTSNSMRTAEGYTYGNGYIVKAKRPTNFSSANRQDWITENRPEYYDEYLPKAGERGVSLETLRGVTRDDLKHYLERGSISQEKYDRLNTFLDEVPKLQKDLRKKYGVADGEFVPDDVLDDFMDEFAAVKQAKMDELFPPLTYDKKLLRTERSNQATDAFDFLIKKEGTSKNLSEWLKTQPYQEKMKKARELGESLSKYTWEEQQPIREQIKRLEQETNELYNQSVQDYMKTHHPDYDPVNKYAHYIHLGTPGEKALEPIRSWRITPEKWENRSRGHQNLYTKGLSAMETGGGIYLGKYMFRNGGLVKMQGDDSPSQVSPKGKGWREYKTPTGQSLYLDPRFKNQRYYVDEKGNAITPDQNMSLFDVQDNIWESGTSMAPLVIDTKKEDFEKYLADQQGTLKPAPEGFERLKHQFIYAMDQPLDALGSLIQRGYIPQGNLSGNYPTSSPMSDIIGAFNPASVLMDIGRVGRDLGEKETYTTWGGAGEAGLNIAGFLPFGSIAKKVSKNIPSKVYNNRTIDEFFKENKIGKSLDEIELEGLQDLERQKVSIDRVPESGYSKSFTRADQQKAFDEATEFDKLWTYSKQGLEDYEKIKPEIQKLKDAKAIKDKEYYDKVAELDKRSNEIELELASDTEGKNLARLTDEKEALERQENTLWLTTFNEKAELDKAIDDLKNSISIYDPEFERKALELKKANNDYDIDKLQVVLPNDERNKLVYFNEDDPSFQNLLELEKLFLRQNIDDIGGVRLNNSTITLGTRKKPIITTHIKKEKLPWSWSNPFKTKTKKSLVDLEQNMLVNPTEVGGVGIHEINHDRQLINNWIDAVQHHDPNYAYYVNHDKNDLAKMFKSIMVEPTAPDNGKYTYQTWLSGLGELHSELGKARLKTAKDMMKDHGISMEEAVKILKQDRDDFTDYLIEEGNLNKHFKPETSLAEKRAAIKILPVAVPAIGAGYLGSKLYESQTDKPAVNKQFVSFKNGGSYLGQYEFKNGGLVRMQDGGAKGKEYKTPTGESIYLDPNFKTYARYIDSKGNVIPNTELQKFSMIYNPENDIWESTHSERSLPVIETRMSYEDRLNKSLGDPMGKAAREAEEGIEPGEDPVDNFRHPLAGMYTQQAIAKKTGNIPVISPALGWLGANAMGVGHELGTIFNDNRPLKYKGREALEDIFNNAYGATIGLLPIPNKSKEEILYKTSAKNMIPDGISNPDGRDFYFKKNGGAIKKVKIKSLPRKNK